MRAEAAARPAALLPASALALTPGRNRGILVSTAEDGKPLARPRLVVPGDVKGARYVSDLVELHVGRVG